MGEGTILSLEEASEIVKLSTKQLYRAAREGRCPFRKVEGRWRIYESELHEWFRSHEPRARSSISADPMGPAPGRPRRGGGSLKAQVIELRRARKAA